MTQPVTVRDDMIVLPTAGIGFDNPNTLFMQTGGFAQDCTYPCNFHNHFLREELIDKEYRRITFENEFLIVEFLPELGGRIWRLYDKLHGEEVVHKNDCVKPYPGGFGGAYTAGGIELNYPFAHSITNTWPRKTEVREDQDGSATYTVSEWERVGRTQWAMSFTLRPGEARLKQRVMIYNRSKTPASFCYWGNAGVPVNDDTRWLYRECMASEHGYTTVYTWPEFKGVDMSRWTGNPEVVGLYFLEPGYDFFGYVDTKKKSGLVHYADRHDVPGKKLWTWGRNFSGEATRWHLCVEPQDYGEVQSGRIVNQEHFEWLMPEEYLSWEEQWSPIHGLTDVTEATEDCAFQIDGRKLRYYPFKTIKDQKLQAIVDGQVVGDIPFSAEACKLGEIDIPEGADVRFITPRQRTLISVKDRCERKPTSQIREDPIFDVRSSMACFVNAEFSHKLLRREKAMEQYRQAIELDRYNYKAYRGLGLMLYQHGDFAASRENYERAIECYKWDGESYLMLAHMAHLDGDFHTATEHALSAVYYGKKHRGELLLTSLDQEETECSFLFRGYGYCHTPLKRELRGGRYYDWVVRDADDAGGPEPCMESIHGDALKDMGCYYETFFAGEMNEDELCEGLFYDEWAFLELALNYIDLQCFDRAEQLCDIGISIHKDGWQPEKIYNPDRISGIFRKRETPFFHMLKGWIALQTGDEKTAKRHFADGDYFEYFCNINQPEMVRVLEKAIEYGNVAACHYLGNFMYHSYRPEEALKYWQMAETQMDCSVNTRNLAVHAQFVEHDLEKARALLRKALGMNPVDLFLRQELIGVERACGASPDDILGIVLDAPEVQRTTFLQYPLLTAYMDANRWEEAAEFMGKLDGRHSDTDSGWYDFCIGYAEFLVDQTQPQEALEWIGKASPTPENLSCAAYLEVYYRRHREHHIAGLAYRMLGDDLQAEESFRKSTEQPATLYYFKPWEDMITSWRFWVALSMAELGMVAAAEGMLCGINKYRESAALIPLKLERSEFKRWAEKDPDAVVTVTEQTGPEI